MQTKHTYQLTDEQVHHIMRLIRKDFDDLKNTDIDNPERCILIAHALHQTEQAVDMMKDYMKDLYKIES